MYTYKFDRLVNLLLLRNDEDDLDECLREIQRAIYCEYGPTFEANIIIDEAVQLNLPKDLWKHTINTLCNKQNLSLDDNITHNDLKRLGEILIKNLISYSKYFVLSRHSNYIYRVLVQKKLE